MTIYSLDILLSLFGTRTMKLLKKLSGKFHNIGFGDDFLDMTPKAQETKEKLDNWASWKFNMFVHWMMVQESKKITCRMVENVSDKILLIKDYHMSDKRLLSRI